MAKLTFLEIMRWNDDECRAFLEQMRWPNGPRCPKCGVAKPYTITRKTRTKNAVRSLYKCRGCKKQFTATVGTIFEDSKIPLHKWFAAIFLMCASKKGISAHQIHRQLDIAYKSAWFMCHRVREAMRDKGDSVPLSGTVEADETYMGRRTRRTHRVHRERIQDEIDMGLRPKPRCKGPFEGKTIVFGMLERGGEVRTIVVPETTSAVLRSVM